MPPVNNPDPSVVALVPARSGSRRVAHKNIRPLCGHPVIAYTICAARSAGMFDAVVVSTDSEAYADVARHYGAEVPFLRPEEISGETSPDIDWIALTIKRLEEAGRRYDCFSILRPTSPFRKPETIRRAWQRFLEDRSVDSLRAVEKVAQHPGKMWLLRDDRIHPLMSSPDGVPWHSQQYAALPTVYVQNASLEIAWTRVVHETGTIAGNVLVPFFTEGDEGVDINNEQDWWYARHLIERGEAMLPSVDRDPYPVDRLPPGIR
jgi:N-acylneuraminate cytidylyltransferase